MSTFKDIFDTSIGDMDQTYRRLTYLNGFLPIEKLQPIIEAQDREFHIALDCACDRYREEIRMYLLDQEPNPRPYYNRTMIVVFAEYYGWDEESLIDWWASRL